MAVPDSSRRHLLRASGLAGLVVAGSAVATGSAQAAPGHTGEVTRADTVTALRALNTKHLTEGTVVLVAGHHTPGDGG
ncbi:peptidase C14, partial [Streptomyces sp. BE147]|nr:peptidase C14 [Streptomyces sp. BE147]